MLKISLSLVSLMIAIASSLDTVPVVIQDGGLLDGAVNSQGNPLKKMSKEEFELVVDTASKLGECLIFFIEDVLSLEDINLKDDKGTAYANFNEAFTNKRVKFFPRVVEPYNHLKNRFQPFDFNTFYVHSSASSLRLDESFKFIYVFFENGMNETRAQKLRRHDTIMQEVYFVVKQFAKGPVVAFYTGKKSPDKLKETVLRTQPKLVHREDQLKVYCGNATFQLDAIMKGAGDESSILKVYKCKYISENNDSWTYQITLAYIMENEPPAVYELKFSFTHQTPGNPLSGWKLEKVQYLSPGNEILKTETLNITSAWEHLYTSQSPLILKPDTKFNHIPTLYINTYNIYLSQPKPKQQQQTKLDQAAVIKPETGSKDTRKYDVKNVDVWNKFALTKKEKETFPEVFVTDVLATCGFIIFILLAILFFGVVMIMNVCTNSIYDNPEQKPLFVADMGAD